MLDPEEQARNGFRAADDRHAERRDAAGPAASPVVATAGAPHAAPDLGGFHVPLEHLYERFDHVATGRTVADRADLHAMILERLADNRSHAERAGWSSLALERDGAMGRLRLIGVAPSSSTRTIVPDWTTAVETESRARRTDAARAPAGVTVRSGMAPRHPREPGHGR